MKASSLLALLLLPSLASPGQAQITITEADVRSRIGTQITTTTYTALAVDGLQPIADLTGGNLTFDFRTVSFDEGEAFTVEVVTCSAELPGCNEPAFATANLITREVFPGASADSVALSFTRLAADGMYLLGGASRADLDETNPGLEESIFTFTPALLSEKLPLTMGTSWTATSTLQAPEFEGFEVTFDESFAVEGWGTLITPAGSASALKLRNRSISSFSVAGQTFSDTSYTVSFITKSFYSASIELDAQGQVLDADYTTPGDLGTGTEQETEVPTRIALHQNYPNPFNPATTIPFTLREAGPVLLTVFDLLGHEVAVLVDETRPAGAYDVTWQPNHLPSGVYLYRLDAAGTSTTRSLTLLK